ncbi:MAG: hypothetical protein RIQ93_1211 [Verrucomicrobiota bacterium]|jgi:uncharacterized delta-60 repeat protein
MLNVSLSWSLLRRFFMLCGALIVTGAALFGQTPSAADGFDPNVDGNVYAVAVQADGKTLIAGQFTGLRPNGSVATVFRNNLARLNADGSVDPTFNPNPNAPVRALIVQPDGRIVIGGDFTTLQPNAGATTTRNRVARLSPEGTVDAGFNPNVTGALQPQVFALALQIDGQIVIGGNFTALQSNGAAVATARKNLARVTAAGAVDPTYDPNPNGMVLALAPHIDGKIIVGGGFTSFQENGKPESTRRNRIARLNPSGTVDSEFNPNADSSVTAIAIERDGKILLGGQFATLQPPNEEAVSNRNHIARLNPSGSLDSEFISNAGGNVSAIAVHPDGGILIGGTFTSVWGRGAVTVARSYLARLTPDGTVDASFNPGLNGQVASIAVHPDGQIVAGGYFTRAQPSSTVAAKIRNRVARLNPNGTIDATFELDAGGRPLASVVQADGRIVIAGSFTSVAGTTHNYLARVNANGTVDPTYNPSLDGRVLAMILQPDGKIIIGGAFTFIGGESRPHIARINPSGTIDSEFDPKIDGQVAALALQSDGRILVGGSFSSVRPIGVASPVLRRNILRLTATGQLDTTFDPSTSAAVTAIAVQPDGKIFLGGTFTSLLPNGSATGASRGRLARVNSDGTVDTTFTADFDGSVSALALQPDGKLVVGGAFTGVGGAGAKELVTRNRLARVGADGAIDTAFDPNANGNLLAIALQPDGKILIGGAFTTLQPNGAADWTLRKYAARLNANGTVDDGFNLDINEQGGNRVDSIRVLADGRMLIGGNFASLAPTGTARLVRPNFARINANGTIDGSFDLGPGGAAGAVVNAIAVQADRKIVVAGSFADLGGATTANIARYTPEGIADPAFSPFLSVDGPINTVVVRPNGLPVASQLAGFAWLTRQGALRTAFAPGANARFSGRINTVVTQRDGSVILGGAFSNLSNATNGNLARFSAAGVLDTSFNPSVNGEVTGLALQSDGRIIIVGTFTQVNGLARNRIARLNANGSPDTTYDPNASGKISAVVVQADDKVVIGGAFSTLTPPGATAAVSRPYLARLNPDSTLDTAYNPTPNFTVDALAIQQDGKVIAGGQFTTVQPNSATTATERRFVVRLNTDGTLDTNFDPSPDGPVSALAVQSGGSIIIGGSFTNLSANAGAALPRNNVARVGSDGVVDRNFNPNPNAGVTSVSVQSDGGILLGGIFTALDPNVSGNGITRNQLARVNADGSVDLAFNPDVAGTVSSVVAGADGGVLVSGSFVGVQPNGLLLVGGAFATAGGLPLRNLALLNNDGSVNGSFAPNPNGAVQAMVTLSDGRFIVGGAFTTIGGVARNRLARFNADGSLDTAYNAGVDGTVRGLALQADGRILVGGSFATANGVARSTLARLNADGTLDATFAPDVALSGGALVALSIAVQPDGRILFHTATSPGAGQVGFASSSLRRLNADGSPDTTFASVSSGETGSIRAITLQTDGRIVIGGAFSSLVAPGGPGGSPSNLARLNSNGTVDPAFNPAPNAAVSALALQADGRLMVGGVFTRMGNLTRVALARLAPTGAAVQTLGVTADRRTLVWTRSGSNGEISGASFELSPDNRAWTLLGSGTRVANGSNWQITGLQLPASGLFYVRARALAPSSAGASSGLYETVREFNFANPLPQISSAPPLVALADGVSVSIDPSTGVATLSTGGLVPNVPGSGIPPVQEAPAGFVSTDGSGIGRLSDISVRGAVGATTPLIAGFTVGGAAARTVLLRAAGPSLAEYGVTNFVATPRFRLYDGSGAFVGESSGWSSIPNIAAVTVQSGAFPFKPGSEDAASIVTLNPGSYTMEVVDRSGAGGVALAEVYDAGTNAESLATRLVNLSGRGTTGSAGNAFLGGFVITGGANKNVLVRGIGPTLANYGVTSPLSDPVLSIFDANGRLVASNDNWSAVNADGLVNAATAAIQSAENQAGAFKLPVGSKDAALKIELSPGAYTVQVSGPAGSSGPAMIELYELP